MNTMETSIIESLKITLEWVIQDQCDATDDFDGDNDAAVIKYVRDVLTVDLLTDYGPEDETNSYENYKTVLEATDEEINLALFGYPDYITSTGSTGSANLLNESPDPLTEWEFPLIYPHGIPVSGDHTTRWHAQTTGHAVTGYSRNLWAGPRVAA